MGGRCPWVAADFGLIASLSLVVEAASLDEATERRLILLVISSASLLQSALQASSAAPRPLACTA